MGRIDTLTNFLTDTADAIRSKTGKEEAIAPADFSTEIESISTGEPMPESVGFANDSWETIVEIANRHLGPIYYKVGDKKTVSTVAVTDTSEYKKNWAAQDIELMIVGFDCYYANSARTETLGIAFSVVNPGNISSLSAIGPKGQFYGWAGWELLKNYINSTVYNAFPSEIKSNIKTSHLWTYNSYSGLVIDRSAKLFMPSLKELGIYTLSNQSNPIGYAKEIDYQETVPGFHPFFREKLNWGQTRFLTRNEGASISTGTAMQATALFNTTGTNGNLQGGTYSVNNTVTNLALALTFCI